MKETSDVFDIGSFFHKGVLQGLLQRSPLCQRRIHFFLDEIVVFANFTTSPASFALLLHLSVTTQRTHYPR
jgi:hypothetical protein